MASLRQFVRYILSSKLSFYTCYQTLVTVSLHTSCQNEFACSPEMSVLPHSRLFKYQSMVCSSSCIKGVYFGFPAEARSLTWSDRSRKRLSCPGRSVTKRIRLSGLFSALKMVLTTSKLVRSLCPPHCKLLNPALVDDQSMASR